MVKLLHEPDYLRSLQLFDSSILRSCKLLPPRVKDLNNGALGSKQYNINGIWALKPYSLGPWTLRLLHRPYGFATRA